MNIDLQGKVALVTGGARGIGAAVVRQLYKSGARVVFNDISEEVVSQAEADFRREGVEARGLVFDVSSFAAVSEALKKLVEEEGALHILVNNAGITRDQVLLRMKEEDWERVLRVNLQGVFNVSRHAVRYLLKQPGAAMVNLASVVGLHGNAGQTNYAASKAGVVGFSKALARETAGRGVRVNVIAPGYIATKMTEGLPESVKEEMLRGIPLGRPGEPDDIAALTVFLVSDQAAYITGQVIQVDGGMYI